MHTGQCSRHQFQVMSVSQLVKKQEGPQMCLEGPSRYISTMDMLATPQSVHKGGRIEVETVKGRPTTSKGCPTLHDVAKYSMQCPTKIKDIPYTPQSLAVGQATWYSHDQRNIVGCPRDERDIPSDTSYILPQSGTSLPSPARHQNACCPGKWDVLWTKWDVLRGRWDVPSLTHLTVGQLCVPHLAV
jgi:hypothetical protein